MDQRKAWDLNPHDLAVARFSKPARPAISGYLPKVQLVAYAQVTLSGAKGLESPPHARFFAALRMTGCQWTHRGSNPDFQSAELVSSRWTMSPGGNAECGIRNAELMTIAGRPAISPFAFRIPHYTVIPDGFEPSLSWLSPRRLGRWTTGPAGQCGIRNSRTNQSHPFRIQNFAFRIRLTEVGVEPTESPGSRPGRFSDLRTRPIQSRVRGSHPASQAYEARLSTGPPAM